MNLVKSLIVVSALAGLAACQGSNGTASFGGGAVATNLLKNSWQAASTVDPKTNVETKADAQGYVAMSAPASGSASSSALFFMVFTADGKVDRLLLPKGGASVEDVEPYTLNGVTITSQYKNADGSLSNMSFRVTRCVPGALELVSDQGGIVRFKQVTDADVQKARNQGVAVAAPSPSPSPSPTPAQASTTADQADQIDPLNQ